MDRYYFADRPVAVSVGDRIRARLAHLDLSQSELARRVRVNQSTIAALLSGKSRSSSHLHVIARELQTTPAYLSGEVDDPDKGAPPPRPAPTSQHIMMPVALPGENALSDMFEGMLLAIGARDRPEAEVARELAQLLPTALSQLRGRLFELPIPPAPTAAAEAPATEVAGPPR